MAENKKIGLFFDLDGSLADTEPEHWASWRDAVLPYDLKLTWEDYLKDCLGHSDKEILKQCLKRLDEKVAPKDHEIILKDKLKRFIKKAKENCLVPKENIKLLKELKGYLLALVTSSTRSEVEAIFYPTKLKDPFNIIVSFESSLNHKPHPEPYIVAKKLLGVSRGLAFEDSPSGLKSATDAQGLKVVKVSIPKELPRLVKENLLKLEKSP